MPSAAVGNNAVQCAIPDLGSGSHSETMRQFFGVIDKKVRNMEKKKSKLDDYQEKKNKGERLNQDQLEALSKYQEIINNLDFARELQKSFLALGQEVQKAVKKSARREQLQREELEQRRLKTVLELQFLLDQLGDDGVRQDLKQPGASGAPLLTDGDLTSFDEFYKLVGPERNCDIRLTEQYEEASLHLWALLEGRDKPVAGTTCNYYFILQGLINENYIEAVKVEPTEFVNRQFASETSYSSTDQDQVEEWSVETQMSSLQHHPSAQLAPEPAVTVNPVAPTPATDPVVRKQAVQDLMAQMQGTYNFMQDSMLEFDGQALDPAIVSAQPMKPLQAVDLHPMVHSEPRLSQTTTVSGPQESSRVSRPHSSSNPISSTDLHVPCFLAFPVSSFLPTQASMSLSAEHLAASCSLSTAFPPVSKPTHSGGINVNAAPFQSVQAVFNLNAPVPPPTDGQAEPLQQSSQFPGGFAQGFNSQSEDAVEQLEMPQERLQSVVGGFQSQDQVIPSAGNDEDSSAGAGFGQSSQSFYNSRAVPRGGPRNARGVMNGYRGSSNGFRGGYEGYRPSFSNAPPTSGYGQTQFSASRDYSNSSYQREGYQQGYKRGTAQGSRGLSRGNAQAMRS
uniref:Cell cycle associated protein 1a n=1 Tax=Nothobranchius furzeri TaxID=105023 RepID=A0A8C6PDD2_NOTFU